MEDGREHFIKGDGYEERVVEKVNLIQVQVDQFLKSSGYKLIAAEHDLHRGALEDRWDGDIVIYGQEEVFSPGLSTLSPRACRPRTRNLM